MEHPVQHAVEQASGPLTYAGAAATVTWGLTADQWTAIGVIVGITFTVLTFAVNWFYRHRMWKASHLHSRKTDR
jgi:hypothetical protein